MRQPDADHPAQHRLFKKTPRAPNEDARGANDAARTEKAGAGARDPKHQEEENAGGRKTGGAKPSEHGILRARGSSGTRDGEPCHR